MYEYLVTVIIDGEEEEIKSYANSIQHVVDSMVSIESVVSILKVTRTKDNKMWRFKENRLSDLKELRNSITDESSIQKEIAKFEKV